MTDRELMQEALDALESLQAWPETPENFKRFRAIEALRARLAQPEPAECDGGQCGIGGYCKQCPKTQPNVPETAFGEIKPVLYQVRGRPNWDTEPKWGEWKFCTEPVANDYIKTPVLHDWEYQVRSLYTAPPQREWVGLTDEEINILFKNSLKSIPTGVIWNISRTIEAKLKEKNT